MRIKPSLSRVLRWLSVKLVTHRMICGLAACGLAEDPGSFSVRFAFRDGLPDANTKYYAFARVERSQDNRTFTVSEANSKRFEPGVQLELAEVPNGRDYVVVAELKASERESAAAVYYGSSKRFSLQHGKHEDVRVALSLRPVPSRDEAELPVRIVEANELPRVGRFLKSRTATLALAAQDATTVVVANELSMSHGEQRKRLDELEQRDGEYLWPDWDLDDHACDEPPCPDGKRDVYVRFENDHGYPSDVYNVNVTVDTRAPSFSSSRVDPDTASDGDEVSLLAIADEALREPPTVRVDPPDFVLQRVDKRSDESPGGFRFTFSYKVDERAVDQRRYSFTAHLADLAGNESDVKLDAAQLEIAGDLVALSTAVERAPAFGAFGRLPFFSRTDAVSGNPVEAIVRVEASVPFRSEPAPVLVGRDEAGHTLAFELDASNSTERLAVFAHAFSAADVAGTYGFSLDWSDRSGRAGKAELSSSLKLRDPPVGAASGVVDMSVDNDGQPNTLYTSRPWGEYVGTVHQMLPDTLRGRVIQNATRIEDCIAQVLIYGDVTPSGQARANTLLGAASVESVDSGTCETSRSHFEASFLGNRDPRITVVPVSVSGYAGHPQTVVHGEWIASLPPGARGGTAEHPHRISSHARTPVIALASGEDASLPAGSSDLGYDAQWESIATNATAPSSNSVGAAAYDSSRGRVLALVVGEDFGSTDVWEWSGAAWTHHVSSGPTPEPWSAISLYDAARDRLVVVGIRSPGVGAPDDAPAVLETWEWDGRDWLQMQPAHVPDADNIYPAGAAYDSTRHRAIFAVGCPAKVWEWDGIDWSEHGALPSNLCPEALGYDPSRDSLIALLANEDSTEANTLEYVDGRWFDLASTQQPTPIGYSYQLAYDAGARSMVLLLYDETWKWNGRQWSIVERGTLPYSAQLIVYDAARSNLIAFGGESSFEERWQLEGSTWVKTARSSMPPPRSSASMAFDSDRNRLVLYGGNENSSSNADLWEHDGSSWLQQYLWTPQSVFTRRRTNAMVYDAARKRTMFVSAATVVDDNEDPADDTFASETLTYDGSSWGTIPNDPSFPPRDAYALSYDSQSASALLFGGELGDADFFPDDEVLGDTWIWDGATWTKRLPLNSPSPRAGALLAQDLARGRALLFGGYNLAGPDEFVPLNDTWVWDGSNWQQLSPAISPLPRAGHALAYDEARQRVVLFGGADAVSSTEAVAFNDTWEWDGASWTQLTPASSPGPRANSVMAYDPVRRRVVLFGGDDGTNWSDSPTYGDFWEWDGSNWYNRTLDAAPRARTGTSLAYDSARKRTVMFGGYDVSMRLGREIADTWEWSGSSWIAHDCPIVPAARSVAAMAYDPTQGAVLMFGGFHNSSGMESADWYGDTWRWNGSVWALTAAGEIAVSNQPGLMHDATGTLLIQSGETRRWTGDDWQLEQVGAAPDGEVYAAVYDTESAQGLLLSSSGDEGAPALWRWNGQTWTSDSGSTPDSPGILVFDSRRHQPIHIVDDYDVDSNRASVLEQGQWRALRVPIEPRLGGTAAAYDEDRDQIVLVGSLSRGANVPTVETWLLSRADFAQTIDVDLTPLIGPSRTPDVQIDGLVFRAVSGGGAGVDAESAPGAELAVWNASSFRSVAANDSASQDPGSLCFESTDPAVIGQLEVNRHWYFRLRSHADVSTLDTPDLRTSAVDLRIRYHLPGATPAAPPRPHSIGDACDGSRSIE